MSNPSSDNNDINTGRCYTVKPSPHLHTANGNIASKSEDDENSPILLEARLSEIIVSLRQLIDTNQQLDEALEEMYDVDLFEALKENDELISRKIKDVRVILRKLKELGVPTDSFDNLPVYHGSLVLKKLRDEKKKAEEQFQLVEKDESGGVYL